MKKLLSMLWLFLISLLFIGCSSLENPNEDYCELGQNEDVYLCEKRLTSYFDTTVSLKLYYTSEDSYEVESIFEYFETTISEYHEYFDKYHVYEGLNNVYTINNASEGVVLDQELYDAIAYVLDQETIIQVDNQSLFNIALNPVLEIWHNARESSDCNDTIEFGISYCPVPNGEIDGVAFPTNPDNIMLDGDTLSISFGEPGMSIDLGGFAKGYVSKIIADHLNELGITYLLNTGNSNVISGGINPNNDDGLFYIALTKPSTDFQINVEYYEYLKVPEGMAVVTSGNYQRFFKGIEDDMVYHHIIDPNTNYPGGYSMSVTIIYPDSAMADILSTAIYLMPLEEAMTFVNQTDNLEAVWYHYDGSVTYSEGFSQYVLEL